MGGVLNIALDPLFMFVILPDGYQVMGAGIATMLSNMISLGYFLWMFHRVRKDSVLGMHPAVSVVIPGASRASQVMDNVKAAELPPLTDAQMQAVQQIYDQYLRSIIHPQW